MNKRNTSTKTDIKKTFITLLHSKGFDNLTVSDIARGAKINRGTFYLHYLDKYDLMEKLEMETIYDLKQIMMADNDKTLTNTAALTNMEIALDLIPFNLIVDALYYIKADFDFIFALSGKGGDPNFPTLIKEVMKEMIQAKIATVDQLHFSKKGIPEDYAMEILLAGNISIIMLWIRKGGIESPEEIARMVNQAKQISPCELLL